MSADTVDITALGAGGDGIARTPEGPVFVPFTCPGDTVKIAREKNQGMMMALTTPSLQRATPACRHFGPDGVNGTCGGCSLQHVSGALYGEFKRDLVVSALRARHIEAEVGALVTCRPGERRRAVFAARKTEKGLLLGFNQAGSHHIVAISECPISHPSIVARLDDIRRVGLAISSDSSPFRISVLETLTGLDIAIDGLKRLTDKNRQKAVECVLAIKGIARLSFGGEILVEPVKPVLRFGTADVSPPPGAFVQATLAAENAMAEMVSEIVGKAKSVADLFCGSGTFALRLAQTTKVHAVEMEEKPLAALQAGLRGVQGLKPVTVERRDLFRRPLMAKELKAFDAVVFDPPRAGAENQVQELARSGVAKIAAVSCNPVTFARDLSLLVDAGYGIKRVTPVDQFLWSPHVEVVAGLERIK
ncbi:class I SAM-dependent RNA methyltransferase [Rhizobium sp. L1K21]|uniref:class I SAM-dependent RNA methyltransferase n=1 Tax=Rhizobium sp. L1K21 TaxID=2954933 RepID=UPI0020928351|nr:class I SAM-dependent RNA methyltransferase [Rhizobium sp. L1K21]MCO6186879.1 class I SAM-dependent RNA methyltransferase [Rhizobium sp. L1K21]